MDKMFWATTVIPALLLCWGIPYSSCHMHHKFLINPIDSVGIIAHFMLISSSAFLLQVCQMHSWCLWDGLVAFEFLQGKKLVGCGFGALSVA